MKAQLFVFATAACSVTLAIASVGVAPSENPQAYVHFGFVGSATRPGAPCRAVAEGGEDRLLISLVSRDSSSHGLPMCLKEDLRVSFSVNGTASLGADYRLVDEEGEDLAGTVLIPAGRQNITLRGVFLADGDEDPFEDIVVSLDRAEVVLARSSSRSSRRGSPSSTRTSSNSYQPARIGENAVARWIVIKDNQPVIQFSHTTTSTFPLPTTKVVGPDNTDYWGLRLTSSSRRSPEGAIMGQGITIDDRIELTIQVSGTATRGQTWDEGVDFLMYDHLQRPQRATLPTSMPASHRPVSSERAEAARLARGVRASRPLELGSTVTVTMPANSPGWALWGEFFGDRDELMYETVELRLIRARRVGTGEPVRIGWNDRVQWIKPD